MKLIKRLNNIWRLGAEVNFIQDGDFTPLKLGSVGSSLLLHDKEEKPRMAQIIHRETATEKLLKEIKENGI